jgi:hypothetical protein
MTNLVALLVIQIINIAAIAGQRAEQNSGRPFSQLSQCPGGHIPSIKLKFAGSVVDG